MSKSLEVEESQHPHVGENEDDGDEEEDEALSLCDLPVTSTRNELGGGKEEENQRGNDSDFDFDFGSLMGSLAALESEMCAADEVFSGGQMLPFRHSVSSEVGLSGFRVPTRNHMSRSDSMDRVRLRSRSTSSRSSRSSSTRSEQSAASSTSSGSSSSMVMPKPEARSRYHFHSHPSPKPQIRTSGARPINGSGVKSTMWQVLRLGLVRTPEIELRDLKLRCRTRKNTPITKTTRSDSVSSSSSNDDGNKIGDLLLEVRRKREPRISNDSNKNGGGIFGSCKCSVGAIDPIILSPRSSIKSNYGSKTLITTQNKKLLSGDDELEQQQQKEREKQVLRQRKRVGSHHRTFEWLRDLSQTKVLNS